MVASAFHVTWKEEENHISGHNWIFKHAYMYKNAHWQSSGFMIFLSKYYIVTLNTVVGSFLGVLFLLLAVILLELHEKPRRKDLVTTKSTLKNLICVRDITFLIAHRSFYVFFCCFVRLLPPPSKVT